MGHIWFLLGALGFAVICALILSDRWHSLSPAKVQISAVLAAFSGLAHFAAASSDAETFKLSWLFGGVGLALAIGWYILGGRLRASQGHRPALSGPALATEAEQAQAKKLGARLMSQDTQRSLAAASTALAFASALAVYMSRIV